MCVELGRELFDTVDVRQLLVPNGWFAGASTGCQGKDNDKREQRSSVHIENPRNGTQLLSRSPASSPISEGSHHPNRKTPKNLNTHKIATTPPPITGIMGGPTQAYINTDMGVCVGEGVTRNGW